MITADGWRHVEFIFSGATFVALVGHAVATFPTPKNIYGQWFLGVIKFAVGQRLSAMNAFQGNDTVVVAVPQGTAAGIGSAKTSQTTATKITPDAITTEAEKTVKTSTTVPNPHDPPKD